MYVILTFTLLFGFHSFTFQNCLYKYVWTIHTYISWLQRRGETTFAALVVNFAKTKPKQNNDYLWKSNTEAEISWIGNVLLHAKVFNDLLLFCPIVPRLRYQASRPWLSKFYGIKYRSDFYFIFPQLIIVLRNIFLALIVSNLLCWALYFRELAMTFL